MNKFSKYLNEDYLYEMATLGPKDHKLGIDIKLHILQPGQHKLSHGPRVKCFKSGSDKDFSISLNEDETKMFLVGEYANTI
jgi:hypothetical protein